MPHSLRSRLLTIVVLLAAAATASGFVMFALFEQSTTARIGQAEAMAGRGCDAIVRAYRFYTTDWTDGQPDLADANLRRDLTAAVFTALRNKTGVEGGMWQPESGVLAYAFPTYEGSGPKTDVPQAELNKIIATNQLAQKNDRYQLTRIDSGAQILLVAACPLPGPIAQLSGWTMTRVHSLTGETYWQLLGGLATLVLSVGLAAILAMALVMTWSRHVASIVRVLADQGGGEHPPLRLTGERELDHIVSALNAAQARLAASRAEAERLAQQVSTGERLAAVGRVTAGVAHEFRNPLAAMRLKAESALRNPSRKDQALALVIEQVDRLDAIIRRLLTASERDPLNRERVALHPFLTACAAPYVEAARAADATIRVVCAADEGWFDPEQMRRALQCLLANALQEERPGSIELSAALVDSDLVLAVSDAGAGPPPAIRDHLFDPFVSGSPDRAGLGLAIVREVAAAHEGHATFERDGDRTVFKIVVPCLAS